jgi:hypothetical protein
MLAIADRLAGTYGVARASDDPQTMALLTAVCGCAAHKELPLLRRDSQPAAAHHI